MAIPAVHIAPLGTNAVDARGMARWLSGGGLMVVSSGMGLYRCMCMCVHKKSTFGVLESPRVMEEWGEDGTRPGGGWGVCQSNMGAMAALGGGNQNRCVHAQNVEKCQ